MASGEPYDALRVCVKFKVASDTNTANQVQRSSFSEELLQIFQEAATADKPAAATVKTGKDRSSNVPCKHQRIHKKFKAKTHENSRKLKLPISSGINREILTSKQHIALLSLPKWIDTVQYSGQVDRKGKSGMKINENLKIPMALTTPARYFETRDNNKIKTILRVTKRKQKRQYLRKKRKLLVLNYVAQNLARILAENFLLHPADNNASGGADRRYSQAILQWLYKSQRINPVAHKKNAMIFDPDMINAANRATVFIYDVYKRCGTQSYKCNSTSSLTLSENGVDIAIDNAAQIEMWKRNRRNYLDSVSTLMASTSHGSCADNCRQSFHDPIMESRKAKLIEIVLNFVENESKNPLLPVFNTANLPHLCYEDLIDYMTGIQFDDIKTSAIEEISAELECKLIWHVQNVDVRALDKDMIRAINVIARQLARKQVVSMNSSFPGYSSQISFKKPFLMEEKTISEMEQFHRIVESFGGEPHAHFSRSETIAPRSSCSPIGPAPDSQLSIEEMSQFGSTNLMPHAKNAICCASFFAWATWLRHVSIKSKHWCRWAHKTSEQLRQILAISEDAAVSSAAKYIALKEGFWATYSDNVVQEIDQWMDYNKNVRNVRMQISQYLLELKVKYCQLCHENGYECNDKSGKSLARKILKILKSTAMWQRWLDSVVGDVMLTMKKIQDKLNDLKVELNIPTEVNSKLLVDKVKIDLQVQSIFDYENQSSNVPNDITENSISSQEELNSDHLRNVFRIESKLDEDVNIETESKTSFDFTISDQVSDGFILRSSSNSNSSSSNNPNSKVAVDEELKIE